MKISDRAAGDSLVRRAKAIHLTTSVLLFASGAFLLLWPGVDDRFLRILVSLNLILSGLAGGYGYFSNDLYRLAFQCDLAFGAFCVLLGALLLLLGDRVMKDLPLVLGIYILLDGLVKLQIAVEGRKFGMRRWQLILLSALVVAAVGAINVCWAIHGTRARMLLGAGMLLDGIENFWTTMYTVKLRSLRSDA